MSKERRSHFLTAVLDALGTEAVEMFPQLKDNTAFLLREDAFDPAGNLRFCGDPAVFARLGQFPGLICRVAEEALSPRPQSLALSQAVGAEQMNVIFLSAHTALLKAGQHRRQRHFFIFDHELGHVLTKNGSPLREPNMHRREASADAFAAIRSLQRFPGQRLHLHNLALTRAQDLFLSQSSSYATTPLIDKILFDAQSNDFTQLSSQQTIIAAEHYAERFHISPARIDFGTAAIRPFHDLQKSAQRQHDLAAMLLQTTSPLTLSAGARVLTAALISPRACLVDARTRDGLLCALQEKAYKMGEDATLAMIQEVTAPMALPQKRKPERTSSGQALFRTG